MELLGIIFLYRSYDVILGVVNSGGETLLERGKNLEPVIISPATFHGAQNRCKVMVVGFVDWYFICARHKCGVCTKDMSTIAEHICMGSAILGEKKQREGCGCELRGVLDD